MQDTVTRIDLALNVLAASLDAVTNQVEQHDAHAAALQGNSPLETLGKLFAQFFCITDPTIAYGLVHELVHGLVYRLYFRSPLFVPTIYTDSFIGKRF